MPVDRWTPETVLNGARREVGKRMKRAMLVLQGDVQRRISRGQPVVRTAGGNLRGLDPSAPGTPPKVVTSRLRTSITHDVREDAKEIVGRVGSNVEYARRLELGFQGTDSRGRNINQAERPYLRPALKESLNRIIRILTTRA